MCLFNTEMKAMMMIIKMKLAWGVAFLESSATKAFKNLSYTNNTTLPHLLCDAHKGKQMSALTQWQWVFIFIYITLLLYYNMGCCTHTHTHARTHARTPTHARTHTHSLSLSLWFWHTTPKHANAKPIMLYELLTVCSATRHVRRL